MIKIPLNLSTFGSHEIDAAINVLRSGFVTMGEHCFDFEIQFAKYLNVKNAVFVNSGSSANLLAFFAVTNFATPNSKTGISQLRPKQEVIVPAVTWSTTIWPILQAGLVPVLVDSDPYTLQMNVESIEEAMSEHTGAICPVHVLGNATAMDPILRFSEKNHLWVIEDTCEALGTQYKNKFVGTLGDMGTYSFFFSHHITTIEGGMIVTDNDQLAELFRCMRAHGWTRHLKNHKVVESQYPEIDPRFLFINSGFNLRPTEINAVFGKEQLPKLQHFNQRRAEIAKIWSDAFSDFIKNRIILPMQVSADTSCTWFGFPIICESKKLRDALKKHLEKNGIETRSIICGNLARQPAFKHFPHRISGDLKGADTIMDQGLFWGSHPLMTDADVEYVIKIVSGFLK